jgi:transcription elongation factor Elf1
VAEKREPVDEVRTCPVCGERVNVYNLNVDPKGNVVGCAICGKTIRPPAGPPSRRDR